MFSEKLHRIYLDYAATTPVAPEVLEAMQPYFSEKFGNPGSLHMFGQEAQGAVDAARNRIAGFLGAESKEIIFTASATEANNLAIRGVVKGYRERHHGLPHMMTTAIEHESVLQTCRDLERERIGTVTYLPVTPEGLIRPPDVERALRKETLLLSIGYANNEIGVIEPLYAISKILQKFRSVSRTPYPLFHTDAVQAVQFLETDVRRLGVDLMTISSHKIYGPKGVAALYVKKGTPISPLVTGGGQESGLRSGTENVAAIVGFAKAIERVAEDRKKASEHTGRLRDMLHSGILSVVPQAALNGAKEPRLPNNLNLSFPGYTGEELLLMLDREGIAVSTGSACRAKSAEPSHVLRALGLSEARIVSSLRFSLGRFTTKDEIQKTISAIRHIFQKA